MPLMDSVRNWLGPRFGGKSKLQQNMEKALRMKKEAGPQTNIPEDHTSHTGGVGEPQMNYTDTALKKEGTYTPNTSRSHNARVGDMGKTTGPGDR